MVEYEREYFTRTAYSPYKDYKEHTIRVEKILSLLQPTSILDVGCGYGYIVKRLRDKGIAAQGVDISKWCEKKAKRIIPGYFHRVDIMQGLPFENFTFDAIYCEGVLEHIPEDKIPFVMQEFRRVAPDKGLLAVTYEDNAIGHICRHNFDWWSAVIPNNYYLNIDNGSSDRVKRWFRREIRIV